jgi:hypothetical protein
MTAREVLNRKMRWLGLVFLVGMGLCFGCMILIVLVPNNIGPVLIPMLFVMLFIVLVNFGIALYLNLGGLRCPKCRSNQRRGICDGRLFSVDQWVHHCPCCGLNIDE